MFTFLTLRAKCHITIAEYEPINELLKMAKNLRMKAFYFEQFHSYPNIELKI